MAYDGFSRPAPDESSGFYRDDLFALLPVSQYASVDFWALVFYIRRWMAVLNCFVNSDSVSRSFRQPTLSIWLFPLSLRLIALSAVHFPAVAFFQRCHAYSLFLPAIYDISILSLFTR